MIAPWLAVVVAAVVILLAVGVAWGLLGAALAGSCAPGGWWNPPTNQPAFSFRKDNPFNQNFKLF